MASIRPYKTRKGRRWEVFYTRPDGARAHKRGFRTKIEAQAWVEDEGAAGRDGTWIDPNRQNTTIAVLAKRWDSTLTRLKPSGARSIRSALNNHVLPKWGPRPVGSIKKSEIQEWIYTSKMTPTTARRAHNVLSQILDMAVDDECLQTNPARGVRLPRKPKPVKVYLTMEQVRTLAEESSRPEIIWLLATSGLRWSELAGLQVGDLDLDGRRAHLQRAAVTVVSRVEVGTLKTHENRKVAIPRFVCNMLAPLIEGRDSGDWVWERADGGPLKLPSTGSFFHCALERVQEADSSFPHVTVHGLRHVAAGLLVSSEANVKVVQRQLGHASAAMTLDQYADLFDGDLDEVADSMEMVYSTLGELESVPQNESAPKMHQKLANDSKQAG